MSVLKPEIVKQYGLFEIRKYVELQEFYWYCPKLGVMSMLFKTPDDAYLNFLQYKFRIFYQHGELNDQIIRDNNMLNVININFVLKRRFNR